MERVRKNRQKILFHIDRIESHYGNVMIRGWAAVSGSEEMPEISVCDADGRKLEIYVERLVREDVNQALDRPLHSPGGMHILIDRASLNTSAVWLLFTAKGGQKRKKLFIGPSGPLRRAVRLRQAEKNSGTLDYDLWIRRQEPDAAQRRAQRNRRFSRMPLFSIVIPLYNTPLPFLKKAVDSILSQTYEKLELCLADGSTKDEAGRFIKRHYGNDPRVRYQRLDENRGISENTAAAMKMATGEFLVFADHDDILAVDALYWLAEAIQERPEADVLYTDEDKINRAGNAYFAPHFKPDFSMELLQCNNYICHLLAVRRDLAEKAGTLDSAFDGAQDYDYVLRCCEQAACIVHIPRVLYHWRTHPDSTAGNPKSKEYAFEAGKRAVEAHYRRLGIDASVEETSMRGRYRTRAVLTERPLVSVLIPNRDHVEDLERCIRSIREHTTYTPYELLVIENNSCLPETEAYYRRLEMESVRILRFKGAFNFSAIHNFAVPWAKGEYLIFLNNDTEVRTERWMEEMLWICRQPDVGAVGAKLYYPDGTIQHAGVVLGLCGVASHLFAGAAGDSEGYAGRLVSVQDCSAVTAACMMTKKEVFERVGGMEEALAVAYNDIDYCMKLRRAGLRVVFTPHAGLWHCESKSRGLEDTPEKKERLRAEALRFVERWRDELAKGDPFYNPNLSLTRTDCALRMPWETEPWRDSCS